MVSRDEWLAARVAFLAKEKEFTRLRDDLSRQRRELPWVRVDKPYVFDGPSGKVALADLFQDRRTGSDTTTGTRTEFGGEEPELCQPTRRA